MSGVGANLDIHSANHMRLRYGSATALREGNRCYEFLEQPVPYLAFAAAVAGLRLEERTNLVLRYSARAAASSA